MEEVHSKIIRWVELIQLDDLEGIADDMKKTITQKPDAKVNKMIFKVLLYLSHTAERCDNGQIGKGYEIFNLADRISSTLSEVPDCKKFFSSIFHIARKLLAMQLWEEATRVCDWLFPGKLLGNSVEYPDMYLRMADLWYTVGNHLLKIPPDEFDEQSYEKLSTIVQYELRFLQIVSKEYTKSVLTRIHFYLQKVTKLTANLKPQYKLNFRKTIITYLEELQLSLGDENKLEIYRPILVLINDTFIDDITAARIEFASDTCRKVCAIFERCVRSDNECFRCLLLHKKLCLMLLKPVEKIPRDFQKEMHQRISEFDNLIEEFGDYNAIKCNTHMIAHILEPIFSYWETCLSAGQDTVLASNVLREIIPLVQKTSLIFSLNAEVCKMCPVKECTVTTDIYNATVLRIRWLSLVCKMTANDSLKAIFPLAQELLEDSISSISEIKESGCRQWLYLWSSCGIHIFNLGVSCHKVFYEESVFLFSLLCTCIVRFEGIRATTSHLNISHPMSYALHRLSNVHYNHGKYREAMTASAFNGLLSYQNPESKAFQSWANIKHKCIESQQVMEMSMLACLRADRDVIRDIGVDIDLIDYDPVKLCLRELKGLQEARRNMTVAIEASLKELESLEPKVLQYLRGVQLFGYHLLNYEFNDGFAQYLQKATKKLKPYEKSSVSHFCLSANLDFYAFVAHLHKMEKKTKIEMESAKYALRASRLKIGQPQDSDNVVPAYTMINIDEDAYLFSTLKKALKKWSICIERNIAEIVKGWQPMLTLHALIITGEYSRLHQFLTCEIHAWALAYRLAKELGDHRACVHVVGRSISLRQVNNEWIDAANEFVTKLRESDDSATIDTIAMFWLSLADFYFETGKYGEATKLLEEAVSLPQICPLVHVSTYLLSVDTMLTNYKLHLNSSQEKEYLVYIVRSLYSMIAMKEYLNHPRWGLKEKQLYGYDILLSSTNHLSLRMNSLLSFKEISSHLIQRLKIAQILGATLRVADCLKFLCFIDLSRLQLDDCEVKLQGLEHILGIEAFEQSRNTKLRIVSNVLCPISPPCQVVDPVRDVRQNDASPILRKKVFIKPDFLLHVDCSCYKCKNLSYQYLVFASTHIRAQLYALQGHKQQALQHFRGGFRIKQKLFQMQCKIPLDDIPEEDRNLIVQHPWKHYYNTVDYVLFLLDFSRFTKDFKSSNGGEGLNIALEALDICKTFNLEGHPIYMSVNELVLEYRFQTMFQSSDFKKFTVPDPKEIDVAKFVPGNKPVDPTTCVTPTAGSRQKKPRAVRRHKTPPLLKLTKVSMNLSDDEESTTPPKSVISRPKASRMNAISRPVRRKILEDECTVSSPMSDSSTHASPIVPLLNLPEEMESNRKRSTLGQIINKAVSLIPDISQRLLQSGRGEELEQPVSSDKIEEVIKMLEEFKVNREQDIKSRHTQHRRKTRVKVEALRKSTEIESSSICEENEKKVGEMIDLFKGMLITNSPHSGRVSDLQVDPSISCQSILIDLTSSVEQNTESSKRFKDPEVYVTPRITSTLKTYSRRRKQAPFSTTTIRVKNPDCIKEKASKSAGHSVTTSKNFSLELEANIPSDIPKDKNSENQIQSNIPEINIVHFTDDRGSCSAHEGNIDQDDKKYEICETGRNGRSRRAKTSNVVSSDIDISKEQQKDAPRKSRTRKKISNMDTIGASQSASDIIQKPKTSSLRTKNVPLHPSKRSTRSAKAVIVYSDSDDEILVETQKKRSSARLQKFDVQKECLDCSDIIPSSDTEVQIKTRTSKIAVKEQTSRTSGNVRKLVAQSSCSSVPSRDSLDDSDIIPPTDNDEETRSQRSSLTKVRVVSKKTSGRSSMPGRAKPKKKVS